MPDLMELLPVLVALIFTGIFAGVLAGLLGVGGGIVIVPVLYFVFQGLGVDAASAMVVATGTSLATIIPTSISSIRAHQKKGNVDWLLLKRWAPFMIVGVVIGSYLVTVVNGHFFSLLFGIIAVLVSLNMLFRAKAKPLAESLPPLPGQGLIASLIGFFSVMVGIGGGTLGVPTLTALNVAAHRAVGTAAAFGLLIALPGALMMLIKGTTPAAAPFGTFGLVNLPGFIAIVPLTVLFAPIGTSLGARLDGVMLKKVFAVVLGFTGVRMLFQLATQYL
ncbi:sulfite exporter TauE/SafE family protein [Halioxenophilus sp. WMMB6]|uniref:sulfite exporter TauE/SafE family protein n=1 Tax=Halioxenophilus sp. WMMB6 TaxID=3073815 RepID=UPI00295EFF7B|nr:sulfite exporter TauE/SafE family protein [Halioxenophilus sp. WMMB6]